MQCGNIASRTNGAGCIYIRNTYVPYIYTRRMQSICGASATSKHKYSKRKQACVGHVGLRIHNDESMNKCTLPELKRSQLGMKVQDS